MTCKIDRIVSRTLVIFRVSGRITELLLIDFQGFDSVVESFRGDCRDLEALEGRSFPDCQSSPLLTPTVFDHWGDRHRQGTHRPRRPQNAPRRLDVPSLT